MECGTFKDCSYCKECPDCCSDFNRMDSPVLSEKEITEIEMIYNIHDFYERKENGSYCIKTTNDGHCIFFLNKGCKIYANRPADCKLYPYDIIKEDNSYYLVLYKLQCINEDVFSSTQEVERILPVIKSIGPWIDDFTNEDNYEKMSNIPYKKLRRVNCNVKASRS